MDLSAIPILDHHCHAIRRPGQPLATDAFRRSYAETTDPDMAPHIRHTVFYMRVIRDLADLLGCEPTEEAVLAARASAEPEAYARRLFDDGNFRALLVDTGFAGPDSYTPAELSAVVGRPVETILRLETLWVHYLAAAPRAAMLFRSCYAEDVRGRGGHLWVSEVSFKGLLIEVRNDTRPPRQGSEAAAYGSKVMAPRR